MVVFTYHRYTRKFLEQSLGKRTLDPLGLTRTAGATVVVVRHESRELLEVDLPVPVEVGLGDHGSDLGLGQGLPEVCHGQPQLLLTDQTVSVPIKHFKGVSDIVIKTVSPLHHHVNKLVEVNRSVRVRVHISAREKQYCIVVMLF